MASCPLSDGCSATSGTTWTRRPSAYSRKGVCDGEAEGRTKETPMLVDPDLNEILNGPRGMLKGVDVCIQAQCLVSAVALIYSTIDALSALTRPSAKKDTNRTIFINWVKKYIRPDTTLRCSAHDLYGARCGILHNYGLNSKLRREGEAKALIYKWREGPDPDPNRNTPLPADALTLYVED